MSTTKLRHSRIRMGLVGIGGYGQSIIDWVSLYRDRIDLIAACDPALASLGQQVQNLQSRGVRITSSIDQLLHVHAKDLDVIWLCLPIPLHLPGTLQALQAGLAVMCEKPAAGCVQDVDRMIQAQQECGKPVLIAFQDMYRPSVRRLKQRLIRGEWGRVLQVRVTGAWPRTDRYFLRNDWAGKLSIQQNGQRLWVLDSPLNNAMAHYAMLALFLAGDSEFEPGQLQTLQAQCFTAAEIENYDTVSLRCTTENGVQVLMNLTHACRSLLPMMVQILCERARIDWSHQLVRIVQPSGNVEHIEMEAAHTGIMEALIQLGGGAAQSEGILVTPELARVHSLLVSAVSEACTPIKIPKEYMQIHRSADGAIATIDNIESALLLAHEQSQTLHETGLYPFTNSLRRMDLSAYQTFSGQGICVG